MSSDGEICRISRYFVHNGVAFFSIVVVAVHVFVLKEICICSYIFKMHAFIDTEVGSVTLSY